MGGDKDMIKAIVSDMDGTLFKDHQESIFHLSKRNEAALEKLRTTDISFFVASGRMYSYGKKVLEDHHFTNLICSGFNGADIYDNGHFPIRYSLDVNIINKVYDFVKNKYDADYIQILNLNCTRSFDDLSHPVIESYKEIENNYHIDKVLDIPLDTYLKECDTSNIGKFSIIFREEDKEETIAAYNDIKELVKDACFVTMSSDRTIELGNKKANKGIFIQYLQNEYHYTKDEIAVVGDALNDAEMFPYSNFSFAMESGKEIVKEKANYIVKDVAEAIDFCIKFNETH